MFQNRFIHVVFIFIFYQVDHLVFKPNAYIPRIFHEALMVHHTIFSVQNVFD